MDQKPTKISKNPILSWQESHKRSYEIKIQLRNAITTLLDITTYLMNKTNHSDGTQQKIGRQALNTLYPTALCSWFTQGCLILWINTLSYSTSFESTLSPAKQSFHDWTIFKIAACSPWHRTQLPGKTVTRLAVILETGCQVNMLMLSITTNTRSNIIQSTMQQINRSTIIPGHSNQHESKQMPMKHGCHRHQFLQARPDNMWPVILQPCRQHMPGNQHKATAACRHIQCATSHS